MYRAVISCNWLTFHHFLSIDGWCPYSLFIWMERVHCCFDSWRLARTVDGSRLTLHLDSESYDLTEEAQERNLIIWSLQFSVTVYIFNQMNFRYIDIGSWPCIPDDTVHTLLHSFLWPHKLVHQFLSKDRDFVQVATLKANVSWQNEGSPVGQGFHVWRALKGCKYPNNPKHVLDTQLLMFLCGESFLQFHISTRTLNVFNWLIVFA